MSIFRSYAILMITIIFSYSFMILYSIASSSINNTPIHNTINESALLPSSSHPGSTSTGGNSASIDPSSSSSNSNSNSNSNSSPRILVLNGGGVKMIVMAKILEEIEKRSGKSIYELFDVIAATSSAGILALALTVADPINSNKAKYSARDLVGILKKETKNIFKKHKLTKRIKNMGGLFGTKYSDRGIKEFSEKIFSEALLSNALTNVIIPTVDGNTLSPHNFTSAMAKASKDNDFLIKDIARATMATPTFFPAAKIKNLSGDEFTILDGAISGSNSSTQAIAYSKLLGFDVDNSIITMIDGGHSIQTGDDSDFNNSGLIGIGMNKLMKTIIMAQSSATEKAMADVFLNTGNYFKIKTNLQESNEKLDNTKSSNIDNLISSARQTIINQSSTINNLISKTSNRLTNKNSN